MRANDRAGKASVRFPSAVLVWAGCCVPGCVLAPGIPGGPLQGTALQAETDVGMSLAPGSVTDTFLDGSTRTTRGAEVKGGPFVGRFGARLGVIDWFDAAADYSWADYGVELRAGLPEWTPLIPIAVSFGHRTGNDGVMGGHADHDEWRLRGEVYPKIEFGKVRLHLLTALGVSTGERVQVVPQSANDFWMLRDETRIETAFGAEVRNQLGVVAVVAMPYYVLDHGPTYDLDGQSALELDRSWGVAAFLKLGLSFTFARITGGKRPERRRSELESIGE